MSFLLFERDGQGHAGCVRLPCFRSRTRRSMERTIGQALRAWQKARSMERRDPSVHAGLTEINRVANEPNASPFSGSPPDSPGNPLNYWMPSVGGRGFKSNSMRLSLPCVVASSDSLLRDTSDKPSSATNARTRRQQTFETATAGRFFRTVPISPVVLS